MEPSITPIIFVAALLCNPLYAAESLKELGAKAEKGDAKAQFDLGCRYLKGDDVVMDPVEGARWIREAAQQGHAEAQFNLGVMCENGEGVPEDPRQALSWYHKAAEQGNAEAQFSLGVLYATGRGRGVAMDLVEAAKWYREAAQQGHAEAQHNLGVMYAIGRGVAKNPAEAARWHRKAAEQGQTLSQLGLAFRYEKGLGVLKDEVEALAWYNVKAISGDLMDARNRDDLERRLGRQAVLRAEQRSKELLAVIEANTAHRANTTKRAGLPKLTPRHSAASKTAPRATGTGVLVTAQGHVLTAAHVVADATNLSVVTGQGTLPATVLRIDKANNVAVLKIDGGAGVPLPIAQSRQVRLGQTVATIGFPNVDIQGYSPKVNRGEISSLNGYADDPHTWQISVPVQLGNSGGPLVDENGNVIGVVISKLGLKAARAIGDLPQSVNYAVKSAYVLPLLEPYLGSEAPEPNQPKQKPSFEDMVAKAQQSVVLILCY